MVKLEIAARVAGMTGDRSLGRLRLAVIGAEHKSRLNECVVDYALIDSRPKFTLSSKKPLTRTPRGAILNSHRSSSRREGMTKRDQSNNDMLKGTLDMMVLRTLILGDAHGHTIAKAIERGSDDLLQVEEGSLYPALHRLEERGWVSSYWGVSDANRKARFYRLTPAGKKQLQSEVGRWRQMAKAIGLVMGDVLEEGGEL